MKTNAEIEGPFNTGLATKVYRIFSGKKRLTLEINTQVGTAQTYLENCPEKKREIEETTRTYETAKNILVEESKKNPRGRIEYTLETGYPKMKNWVTSKGREIFKWDLVDQTIDDPEKIKAHSIIYS